MLALSLLASSGFGQEQLLNFDGDVPMGGPDHFLIPFTVPAGIVEIEVRHDDLSDENILDWGLNDPAGFRGWGGGNIEPAIVGIDAASRSYLPGKIAAGPWAVVVGKAKIAAPPGSYQVEVVLRDVATLSPMTERVAYQPAPALDVSARWYAGDFHVHSLESGDANASLDAIAALAESRGLGALPCSGWAEDRGVHLSAVPSSGCRCEGSRRNAA